MTGRVLGVDTGRLADVAYSGHTDLSSRQLADQLVPPSTPKPLTLSATGSGSPSRRPDSRPARLRRCC